METAESENKRPFNCEHGPLIRFFVFYSETDFDVLAIVHHLIGDGNAIARLLRDVVVAYEGFELSHQEQILISSQNDFPHSARPTFLVKTFTQVLNKMWDKGEHPRYEEHDFQKMFDNYHQITDIGLCYSTINASEMTALYYSCKEHGITINEAVVTSFIWAIQENHLHLSNEKTVIGIPINMRKQLSLSTDRSLGNFTSAITVKERYNTNHDFWRNAVQLQRKLKSKLKSAKAPWVVLNLYSLMNPLLIDAMYFSAYGQCQDKAAKKAAAMLSIDNPSSAAISNLGRLNFSCQIGSSHIRDMVFLAPKAPGSYVVLGIATLGDTMQLGFSYDRKIISSDTMRNISSMILETLKNTPFL